MDFDKSTEIVVALAKGLISAVRRMLGVTQLDIGISERGEISFGILGAQILWGIKRAPNHAPKKLSCHAPFDTS